MTVATLLNRVTFAADGTSTVFAYPFKITAAADLIVLDKATATEDPVPEVLDTDYTVSGVGSESGGNVTFTVAPTNGHTIVIYRDPAITQTTDWVDGDADFAAAKENAFDKLTMICQRLSERVDRAFALIDSDTTVSSMAVPSPEANKLIGWNSAGTALENKTVGSVGAITVSSFMSTLLDDSDAATARTTLGAAGLPFTDAAFEIVNDTSPTAKMRFDLGSISSGTTRIIWPTNADYNVGPSTDLINLTLNYTYLSAPGRWRISLRNHSGTIPTASFPVYLRFRDTTENQGSYDVVGITSDLNFVIGDGSTFGTVDNVPFRLYVVAVNNNGTIVPGIYNPVLNSGGVLHHRPLDEGLLYSSTAGSNVSTADSAHVLYTTTAVTNKPIRILGYIEGVQTTAGTHANGVTRTVYVTPSTPKSGSVISTRKGVYTNNPTNTNPLPNDNTVPTSTEGDQYMSEAYTPISAANILQVSAVWQGAHNSENHISAALFKDGTTLRAGKEQLGTTNMLGRVDLSYQEIATNTTSRTYTVRAGAGGAGTTTFNGQSAGSWYGGVVESYLEIKEIFV